MEKSNDNTNEISGKKEGIIDFEGKAEAILFDMDGVLVDVTDSYRKAIAQTVEFFTAEKVTQREIQNFKQQGGYNNDWDLTEAIIKNKGKIVPKTELITKFQEYYLGIKEKKGLIENEQWLLSIEILQKLKDKYALGIVTGRPRYEAHYVLKKFKTEKLFDVIIVMEDYPPEKAKPDPYPINLALKKLGITNAIYIGDSVDDIIAAKRANIKPVGCIPPGADPTKLEPLLLRQGAEIILEQISDLKKAISTK